MEIEINNIIDEAFENINGVSSQSNATIVSAINEVIGELDTGSIRVANKNGQDWIVNETVKKAILLYFRVNDMKLISGSPGNSNWWDKIDSKFFNWKEEEFKESHVEKKKEKKAKPIKEEKEVKKTETTEKEEQEEKKETKVSMESNKSEKPKNKK